MLVSAVARVARRRRLRVGTRTELARRAVDCLGVPVRGLSLHLAEAGSVPGWVGPVRIAGIRTLVVRPAGTGTRVIVDADRPVDLGLLLAALLSVLQPVAPLGAGPRLTMARGLGPAAAALAPHSWGVLSEPAPKDDPHLRADDLVVVGAHTARPPAGTPTVALADDAWFVDPTVHRPFGRELRVGPAVCARGTLVGGATLQVALPDGICLLRAPLSAADVSRLLSVDAILVDAAELPPALRYQVQACGVLLAQQVPEDGVERQWLSVQGRVSALRERTPPAWLDRWPRVSAVLLTHRRDHLEHIADQLGGLRYPHLEILIGLHGPTLTAGQQQRLRVRAGRSGAVVRITSIDADLVFGAAMQQACQQADGELVTKVDDDDWYAPTHIWDLVIARTYSGAQIVGKALDWVVLPEHTVLRPAYPAERYALFVAGGTMLISRADLDEVGGWRPVPRSIDRALLEQVRRAGGLVYRTHGLGYLYSRVGTRHTARVADEHFTTKVAARWPGLLRHEAFGTQ